MAQQVRGHWCRDAGLSRQRANKSIDASSTEGLAVAAADELSMGAVIGCCVERAEDRHRNRHPGWHRSLARELEDPVPANDLPSVSEPGVMVS